MENTLLLIDRYVILIYRLTGNPPLDFLIGTALLAALSVAAGELTAYALSKANRRHMEKLDKELAEAHEASLQAKRSGDDEAYRHLNREANDAFGKIFFNMFTFSAAHLWAAFMVLAWMQLRFREVEFPLPVSVPVFGESVGYVFIFFLLYVLSRIAAGKLKANFSS